MLLELDGVKYEDISSGFVPICQIRDEEIDRLEDLGEQTVRAQLLKRC
jgi:hypothetical protein